MATERQVEANRRNAALSSGPRSEAGKAASRSNAVKHGLCCETIDAEGGAGGEASPEFRARREAWAGEYRPEGAVQGWALDRAVVASFRIERCERAMEVVIEGSSERASLAWDEDRDLDAAKLGSRLAKNPGLIARKLEASYHGAALMLDWWTRLGEPLKRGEDWSEAEGSTALDLLGIPTHLRSGRTPVDDPAGGPDRPHRLALVAEEVARLESLQQIALEPLDNLARHHATLGDDALTSTAGKLVARYEREAWRRHREAVGQLARPTPNPEPQVRPKPAVAPRPRPTPPPIAREEDEWTGGTREELLAQARAEIARSMKELQIDDFPPGFDEFLAMGMVGGTNPIRGGFAAVEVGSSGP